MERNKEESNSPAQAVPQVSYGTYEDYDYFEIENEVLDSVTWEAVKQLLQDENKKALLVFPANFRIAKVCRQAYYDFFEQRPREQTCFVSKPALHWSNDWRRMLTRDFLLADEEMALQWTLGSEAPAELKVTPIGDLVYLKCIGDLQHIKTSLNQQLEQALSNISLQGRITRPLARAGDDQIKSWSLLHGALVLDIANLFPFDHTTCRLLQKILAHHQLTPLSRGVFWVTSSLFQSWLFHQHLKVARLPEIGNIIRTVPQSEVSYDDIIKAEANTLAKYCRKEKIGILVHRAKGPQGTLQAMQRFHPEFIICDEMGDARQIRKQLPAQQATKVFHATTASDPGIMLLTPSLITQGYDMQLFAQYVIAQYQNKRGRPNQTFIYYFDCLPEKFAQVLMLIRMEFTHVLDDNQQNILTALEKCETDADKQGSFIISLLEDQILSCDLQLSFSEQGAVDFFKYYGEIFPHHSTDLCNALRIFIKKEPAQKETAVNLHLIEDFNEIAIKQDAFSIDVRLQRQQTLLTIKSLPDESLERRCFSLFSLLTTTNIFSQLVHKEILIDLISLLWENFTDSYGDQQHGFLITLLASTDSCKLQIFQNTNNRAVLTQSTQNGETVIQFAGEIPCHKNTARRFFKPISLFFASESEEPSAAEKNWRFACFEALSLVMTDVPADHTLCFDFTIAGPRWTTTFLLSAAAGAQSAPACSIAPHTLERIRKGVDKYEIQSEGRQIVLFHNPAQEEAIKAQKLVHQAMTTLRQVEQQAMLQEVEAVKAREEEARSLRLQEVYAAALQKLKIEDEAEEDEKSHSLIAAAQHKTVDRRVKRRRQDTHLDRQLRTVLKRLAYSGLGLLIMITAILIPYIYRVKQTAAQQQDKLPLILVENTESPAPVKRKPKPPTPASKLPARLRHTIVRICQLLSRAVKPNHKQLNACLRELYFLQAKGSQYPDLYNLTARIYVYKLYLDKDAQLFRTYWKKRWQKEARKYFQKARSAYLTTKNPTVLKLSLYSWMPEYHWYKFRQLKYDSTQKAADAMQYWLSFLRRAALVPQSS